MLTLSLCACIHTAQGQADVAIEMILAVMMLNLVMVLDSHSLWG
jgi:hypothetical protein